MTRRGAGGGAAGGAGARTVVSCDVVISECGRRDDEQRLKFIYFFFCTQLYNCYTLHTHTNWHTGVLVLVALWQSGLCTVVDDGTHVQTAETVQRLH